ncbi:hypothetical protein JCM6882_008577 [Rhodosporidiobolus microsporus]
MSKAKEAEAEASASPPDEHHVLPPYSPVAAPSSPPSDPPPPGVIEYHVYRQGAFTKHDIVTGPDKSKILYHLEFPFRWNGSWSMTLRRRGPTGEEVCKIIRRSFKGSFEVRMASEIEPRLVDKPSWWKMKWEFESGKGGERLVWLQDGGFLQSTNWTLHKTSDVEKPKEERIQPGHTLDPELILATALGVEIYAREQRESGG